VDTVDSPSRNGVKTVRAELRILQTGQNSCFLRNILKEFGGRTNFFDGMLTNREHKGAKIVGIFGE
jgi:hypothetical protein